ncbi:MAG TPA: low-complexity protein, partial [Cyanophyceae cyanobacterium]
EQKIATEEIQQKVIVQAIKQRIVKDPIFQRQLLQWEETADESARFSLVGKAVRLAIALILSESKSN